MNKTSPIVTELTIMLVTHEEDNVECIKKSIKALSDSPDKNCHLWRCKDASLIPAMAVEKRYEIDIVLLCLGEDQEHMAMQSFYTVHRAFPDTPIITLSCDEDKDIALAAIEEGAASNVTYKDMREDAQRMTTTIEYTLARYKSIRTSREYVRDALKYLRKQNRSDLRTAKAAFAQELHDEKARISTEMTEEKDVLDKQLGIEQRKSAVARRQKDRANNKIMAEKKRAEDAIVNEQHSADALAEKEMIIRWMGGGYSVQKVPLA